jgi:hypothetical protein
MKEMFGFIFYSPIQEREFIPASGGVWYSGDETLDMIY